MLLSDIFVVALLITCTYFILRTSHYRKAYYAASMMSEAYREFTKRFLVMLAEEERFDLIEKAGFKRDKESTINGLDDVDIPDSLPEDF